MRKIFFISIYLTIASANPLPLVHYDPFYKSQIILHTHTHKRVQNRSLTLSAIFNNRAFINNKFYTIGEKIRGYRIEKIYRHYIVLQGHNSIIVLHMQKKHLLQINNKKKER